jgi:hypothetical protein
VELGRQATLLLLGAARDGGRSDRLALDRLTPELFVEGIGALGTWDVAPDGQSVIALERRRPLKLHLVQNWFTELERLVPPIRK